MTLRDFKTILDSINVNDDMHICVNDGYEIEDIMLDTLELPNENIEYIQLKCSSLH